MAALFSHSYARCSAHPRFGYRLVVFSNIKICRTLEPLYQLSMRWSEVAAVRNLFRTATFEGPDVSTCGKPAMQNGP